MKRVILSSVLVMISSACFSQNSNYKGTHPTDSAVLLLLKAYGEAFDGNQTVAERDAKRK